MRIAIDWSAVGKSAALFAAIGAFLAFVNPYDATHEMSYIWSFFYWTGLIFVGGITGRLGIIAAENLQSPPHWALFIFLASATSAFGVTIAIYFVEMMRVGRFYIPLSFFPQLYGLVFVISLAISSITYLFEKAQNLPEITGSEIDPISKFMERLPIKFRTSELFAISSEDHYLRIHTSLGEELILMRLADAIRELSGADGLQTHRSWWVAKSAVSDTKREGGKLALVLKSGVEVPVSRTYSSAIKEAGLAG